MELTQVVITIISNIATFGSAYYMRGRFDKRKVEAETGTIEAKAITEGSDTFIEHIKDMQAEYVIMSKEFVKNQKKISELLVEKEETRNILLELKHENSELRNLLAETNKTLKELEAELEEMKNKPHG